MWKKDKLGYGLMKTGEPLEMDDPLFLKKGWNKIDSGFRLWGRNVNGGNACRTIIEIKVTLITPNLSFQ